MDIVFNINKLGLEGLGATLSSLIRNCSNTEFLKIWYLNDGLDKEDIFFIDMLMEYEMFKGEKVYIDFDAKKNFGHLKSLHGDWTTYGRLLIPEIIDSSFVLYLDSDLIINVDVLKFEKFNFQGKLLGAVRGGKVENALDYSFFSNKLGWSSDISYFNAGVLLINLDKWRLEEYSLKWREIGDSYPNELVSADQTILNSICKGNFAELPSNYNLSWKCGKPQPTTTEDSIIHFVGSPKPWDFLGIYLHYGYQLFDEYNMKFWKKRYMRYNIDKLLRTWKIRRSIIRCIKSKLFV